MKVLCTCLPGYGHFHPLRVLASAAAGQGHDVAFATAKDFCPLIEEMGFAAYPAGISLDEQLEKANATIPEAALPQSKERFETFVPQMLAGVAAPPRAEDVVGVLAAWQPDLLLHEETEMGGPVAAAVAGIPWATQSVGILRPLAMARRAGQTMAPLAERWGVDLGPWAGLARYLYLDVCPPRLQNREIDQVPVAHPMRNVFVDTESTEGELPSWLAGMDRARPTVYISLGTIFNHEPEVFTIILAGLAPLPLNLIVTLGPGADPRLLGPQPDHVHVEAFIPQDLLLPHCDVVVNQGGTAILSILGHGLPVLVLPQGANQFTNAEACVAAGVGRRLLRPEVTPDSVRREVLLLLEDPRWAETARSVAREIAAMPGPDEGVALLERLAAERAPLVAR
jgi:UDP:flavonoid glycosyltransferase YjiC (YdhE family)